MKKSMSKSVKQPSCRAVGQKHVEWQIFEKLKTMYGSQAWVDLLPYIYLLFSGFSNICHSACVWPTFLIIMKEKIEATLYISWKYMKL